VSPTSLSAPHSLWQGFLGHADVRASFLRAIQRQRLTQAYAFVGPDGIGKYGFARRLAQYLLCERRATDELEACGACLHCRPFLADTHPDFLTVARDPGKRELTVAKFVGDRDQRGKAGLCYELSIRPVAGSRKIAIINDADTMNDEAANALLKTLEEPPEGAVLILIASGLESLLPTIRSRCQLVRFRPLADADVQQHIVQQHIEQQHLATDPADVQLLVGLAGGSLSAAERLAQPGLRDLRRDWLRELSNSPGDGMRTAARITDAIDQITKDTAEQRQIVHWLLLAAAEFYRAALHQVSGRDEASALAQQARGWIGRFPYDADALVDLLADLLDRCGLAGQHLEQNVSLGLCLEALCHDLTRLTR
jgi:DNA polymerase III subunit delta'